ncbi:hypothetical protein OAW22_07920 [Pseudomonadales bacterium]|nr:hypothetical protein [Pseudomonadales bacterium]
MYLIKTIALIYLLATSVSALAAASGSSPKGKPFVELQGQLVEVKEALNTFDQILEVVLGRVDSLEESVGALDAEVAFLESQNLVLEDLISLGDQRATSLEVRLLGLQQDKEQLNDQVELLGAADDYLAAEIELIEKTIEAIQHELSGFISLEERVAYNELLLVELVDELETFASQISLKQNVINQTCPENYFVTSIEDGVLQCSSVPEEQGPIELFEVEAVQGFYLNNRGGAAGTRVLVGCPAGSSLVGGYVKFDVPSGLIYLQEAYIKGTPPRMDMRVRQHPRTYYTDPAWAPYRQDYWGNPPADKIYYSAVVKCLRALPAWQTIANPPP